MHQNDSLTYFFFVSPSSGIVPGQLSEEFLSACEANITSWEDKDKMTKVCAAF